MSVVVPAHNDAAGLRRLLPELAGLDVTVVANGCTDDTAAVARAAGVRVLELPEPGKAAALNAGDAAAAGFPRVYLDADVRITAAGFTSLLGAFKNPEVYAATLHRQLDVTGRPVLLRGYYAIHTRLPGYSGALYGRGVIAVSEAGRARFAEFGDLLGDDLYLDRLFAPAEKAQAPGVSIVDTPRRTADLVSRLARVRAGTAQQGATGTRTAWLRIAAPRPWLWPAALCYAGIVLAAERRRRSGPVTWERHR